MHNYVFLILHCKAFLHALGQQQKYEIHQSPSKQLRSSGESTELHCSHSVSSFNTILWYQQPIYDTSLKLIANVFNSLPSVDSSFASHYNVSGHGTKRSTLHIVKLRAGEDSAVYYCAASAAQCFKSSHSVTKTFNIKY